MNYRISAIICDLDGTIALNNGHRSPYDFSKVLDDEINEPIRTILEAICKETYYDIIYVSGRDDSCKEDTLKWLDKNDLPIFYDEYGLPLLFMRKTGDNRKDSIVKEEIYREFIEPYFIIKFCLDDRNQVVEMWRSIGLVCLQVAEGNF